MVTVCFGSFDGEVYSNRRDGERNGDAGDRKRKSESKENDYVKKSDGEFCQRIKVMCVFVTIVFF